MKSHDIDFLVSLLLKVLQDSSEKVSKASLTRDVNYLLRRVKGEGVSFLTQTLPRFYKAVVEGIETGAYVPPAGFALCKGSRLPRFLQGWTKRIFDPQGLVLSSIDEYSFSELCQICHLLYKLEIPCSQEQDRAVITRFIQNENELCTSVLQTDSRASSRRIVARDLIRTVLRGLDGKSIRPKHGPGAVAGREKGNRKFAFGTKYQRLHSKYPYYEYFAPSLSATSFGLDAPWEGVDIASAHVVSGKASLPFAAWYKRLVPAVNPVARVVLVPKDSRGPRLISMEPLEIQWIQQGLSRLVTSRVLNHPLTKGRVNFKNQSFNQKAALQGSIDRLTATIDLKDASDRVSLELVRELFPKDLIEYLEACRSVATELPGGSLQALRKHAPMGSALCFPVMALVVWALSEAAIRLKHRGRRDILVFGDDLVIPSEDFDVVSECLHENGLLVNTSKSFVNGPFRESCGCDAINGVITTPIRVKKALRGVHPDHSVYTHLIELSDAFFDKGFWSTCGFIREHLRRTFGAIPWTFTGSCPGYRAPTASVASERNAHFRNRWNADLQRQELFARTVVPITTVDAVTNTAELMKGLTGLYMESDEDNQVTLRGKCVLRRDWCPA